jgi:membrane protease YdiL (CAAX protease family)
VEHAIEWRLFGIACSIAFILWVRQGPYPRPYVRVHARRREAIEAALIVTTLLLIPHLRWGLLWYTSWLGPYLMFALWGPYLFETLSRRRGLTLIGLAAPLNPRKQHIVWGILGLILLSKIVDPLGVAAGPYDLPPWSWSRLLILPVVEEVLFRGLLQVRLESLWGTTAAWVTGGTFFGAYHYYVNYLILGRTPTPEGFVSLAYIAILGMLLGVVAAKTRSLLPGTLVHMLNNFTF